MKSIFKNVTIISFTLLFIFNLNLSLNTTKNNDLSLNGLKYSLFQKAWASGGSTGCSYGYKQCCKWVTHFSKKCTSEIGLQQNPNCATDWCAGGN